MKEIIAGIGIAALCFGFVVVVVMTSSPLAKHSLQIGKEEPAPIFEAGNCIADKRPDSLESWQVFHPGVKKILQVGKSNYRVCYSLTACREVLEGQTPSYPYNVGMLGFTYQDDFEVVNCSEMGE